MEMGDGFKAAYRLNLCISNGECDGSRLQTNPGGPTGRRRGTLVVL
jgi:hypothetical protein